MGGDDESGGPRRFLIAAAVAEHAIAGSGWDRPGLHRAHDDLVDLFTQRFGYTLVETVGMNPTAAQLLDALDLFCHDPDRRPDDILAVYFTGHGERLDELDRHVLFTADTDPERPHLAIRTSAIADAILFKSPVRRLLLMLDTCFSGSGSAEFAATALDSYLRRWGHEPGNGIVVLSSAQPRQFAEAGRFPRLLTDAAGSLAAAGYSPPVIAIPALVTEIRKHTGEPAVQDVVYHLLALTEDVPAFLPNPRYHPRMTDVDLALQQAHEWEEHAERREIEFRTRLLVRAMGNRDNKGWWFCGRHAALTDITAWLARPDPARSLLAVTGDPGSGKTAVLGLIATLTHPKYWRTAPVHTLRLPRAAIPEPGAVDVAIYAQNLTTDQVRDGIAATTQVAASTVGELADALRQRETTLTVLIDGLDEAADPRHLTRNLLRPLLDHVGTRIRLLVGTRPYLLDDFGLDRESALDLDSPRYADLDALRTYAVRGLVEAEPGSIYTSKEPAVIRAVAAVVAEQANPSFLVARIVAATLSADPVLPDPRDPVWRDSLPTLPGEAMRQDLEARLGDNADRARNLLRPLAFAQGQGLPWEDLWAPIASTLASETYTDEDLLWLRRTAGSYVVEATEDGRSAYRLYHQALAEYLAHDRDPAIVHAAFLQVLRRRVPLGSDARRDWALAHPYTLRHLATHAACAGLINELITDMDYLVQAEPGPLLAAMLQVDSEDGLLIRAVYRCYHHHLPPIRRRQVLAIEAARFGATRQQHQLCRTLEWQPRWATGALTHAAHRTTLTGHISSIEAVACMLVDGRPVAVTGSMDRTVRVWDLSTGIERAVLTGHTGSVDAVACTLLDGHPVAVTGSTDRTVRVWDLSTGIERALLTGHTDSVEAVACTQIDGRPVAVTGSWDKTVRVWDLSTGIERSLLTGHTDLVRAVACIQIGGRPVTVTGSADRTVRVWDLSTGTEHAVLTGHTGTVRAVTCTLIGRRLFAVTAGFDRMVRVWDLTAGSACMVLTGHTDSVRAVACTLLGGRPVAVTGSDDRTVRVWDLSTGTEHAVLTGHTGTVRAVTCTVLDGRPVAVTGSFDSTVRVWELDAADGTVFASGSSDVRSQVSALTNKLHALGWADAEPVEVPNTGTNVGPPSDTSSVSAVACTLLDGHPVAVTGSDDRTVRVWDLTTGTERAVLTGHTGSVFAATCTEIDGRPVAVTGSFDTTVRVCDLSTGTEHGVLTGHTDTVRAVACTLLDGLPVAVTGSDDRTVRVWDLTTGIERAVLTGHTGTVRSVACTQIDGHPVAVTGSTDRTVRVWDLSMGAEHAVLTGHTDSVHAVACTLLDGLPVAVTGSDDRTVRVWDLTTGIERAVLTGHTGTVRSVACTQIDGRLVAVTGSFDRTVRMWDLSTRSEVSVLDCPERASLVSVGSNGEIVVGLDGDIAVLVHRPAAARLR
ncbi:caspase family protein [Nocardia sp. NPDC004085]